MSTDLCVIFKAFDMDKTIFPVATLVIATAVVDLVL